MNNQAFEYRGNVRQLFPAVDFEPVWISESVDGATVHVERSRRFGKERYVVLVQLAGADESCRSWSLAQTSEGQDFGWAMDTASKIHKLLKLLGPYWLNRETKQRA